MTRMAGDAFKAPQANFKAPSADLSYGDNEERKAPSFDMSYGDNEGFKAPKLDLSYQ